MSKPTSLAKDLFKANKNENDKIKYLTINEFNSLMNDINIKEIPENENLKKVVNILEKIFSSIKQEKCTGIKMLIFFKDYQKILTIIFIKYY